MLETLHELMPRKFLFADVGARWGIAEPWRSYDNILSLISFEPDSEEFEILRSKTLNENILLNIALWREAGFIDLHLTKSRGCSSLYRPNIDFLRQFPNVERFAIEKTVKVATATLDSLFQEKKLKELDFIKVDVQGAELGVLQGGRAILHDNAIGIEVEVEFAPMYIDQPLFADVDAYVRTELGLALQDIRRTYWKNQNGMGQGAAKGQLIFGDALYFRPLSNFGVWLSGFTLDVAREKILMAITMGIVYGYFDYVSAILCDETVIKILPPELRDKLKAVTYTSGRCFRPRLTGVSKLAGVLYAAYKLCEGSHGGWATYDNYLGSRKKWGWFQ